MNNISKKDMEWLLNLNKEQLDQTSSNKPYSTLKKTFGLALIIFFGIIGLMILPFYLLVRASVYFNVTQGYSAWVAMAGGVFVTIVLLLIYMLFLFKK